MDATSVAVALQHRGNDPEELLNDTETTASANVVRYVLIVAVRSQVDLLQLLYRKGLLRTEIPGGFSPEEAQALWIIWCAAISARRCRASEWQPVTEMPIWHGLDSNWSMPLVCPCHTGSAWDERRK